MASIRNTFSSRFNDFVNLHAFLSEQNNKRVFHRRFYFPLKKKSNVASDRAYLFFKRSATNFFVTLFAHGKVLYSCSSGIVGLKKKQRRWSSAAFLIGTHFFTFLKNYLSFRSGTTVYRNKPLGKIVVILRSPWYLFNLFYISYSSRYKHIISQIKLRRRLAHRSANSDLLIRDSINRSNKESAMNVTSSINSFSELLLRYTLSDARTCSSVYFRSRASWLNFSKYYCSVSKRTNAAFTFVHLFQDTVLQSTELILPPMSGRLSSHKTTLSAFFSSYASVSTIEVAVTQPVKSRVIPLSMRSTFFSIPSFCNSSFFSFVGGVYFGSHKDTNIPFTPFLIDSLNAHRFSFAQRYYQTSSTFSQVFFFSLCNSGFNSNVFVLSYRVSYSYLLSYFFFNLISTCMPSTLSVMPSHNIPVSYVREHIVSNDWSVLYHNLFVINGLLFISSFHSSNYESLFVILRSGLLTYQLHNDLFLFSTTSYPTVLKRRSFFTFLENESYVLSLLIRSLRLMTCLGSCPFFKLVLQSQVYTVNHYNYRSNSNSALSENICRNVIVHVSGLESSKKRNKKRNKNRNRDTDMDMSATNSTFFATCLVDAYTKIVRFFGRLARTYVNTFFYTKQLTRQNSPFFSDVSFLYSMLNRSKSIKIKKKKQKTRPIVFFIKYQLRSHRRKASTSTVHTHVRVRSTIRQLSFFLDSRKNRRSFFFNPTESCVSFVFKITPYLNAFFSNFFFGLLFNNRTIACIVFTRAMSSMYTVFFKHFLLFTLYIKLFTYSSFFTPDSRSLSYFYFFNFFFSVFFIRSWTRCFVDHSSSQLQTNVLNRHLKLSKYEESAVFPEFIGFHIFMFIEKSTFPFNGCKGKKKN